MFIKSVQCSSAWTKPNGTGLFNLFNPPPHAQFRDLKTKSLSFVNSCSFDNSCAFDNNQLYRVKSVLCCFRDFGNSTSTLLP